MPYCTQKDLIYRFGEREVIELADRDDDGVIDTAVLNQALEDAGDEIDVYVATAGYPMPLSRVPSVLVRIACDIARFRLYDDNAPDEVEDRYKAAVKFLESVASGKVSLGPADDGSTVETSNTARIESTGHVFKRSDHGFM